MKIKLSIVLLFLLLTLTVVAAQDIVESKVDDVTFTENVYVTINSETVEISFSGGNQTHAYNKTDTGVKTIARSITRPYVYNQSITQLIQLPAETVQKIENMTPKEFGKLEENIKAFMNNEVLPACFAEVETERQQRQNCVTNMEHIQARNARLEVVNNTEYQYCLQKAEEDKSMYLLIVVFVSFFAVYLYFRSEGKDLFEIIKEKLRRNQ